MPSDHTVPREFGGHAPARWAYLCIALAYLPTLVDFVLAYVLRADELHRIFVAAAILGLAWHQLRQPLSGDRRPRIGAGTLLLSAGLLLFAAGRALGFLGLEVGSLIPVLFGAMLMIDGIAASRAYWLPVALITFLIPVPEMIAEAATAPLKLMASAWAAELLYALDYPVARAGVVLTIGKYQLLIADACSGMRSILSLYALAFVYLKFRPGVTWLECLLLLLAILPIAVLANFIRVVGLLLLVFYQGESAVQGPFHGLSGLALLTLCTVLFMALDHGLQRLSPRWRASRRMQATQNKPHSQLSGS